MTQDTYRPDGKQDVEGGARDASGPRSATPSKASDATPDILEVFGSQPLVQASLAPIETPPKVDSTPDAQNPNATGPRVVVVPAPGPTPAPVGPKSEPRPARKPTAQDSPDALAPAPASEAPEAQAPASTLPKAPVVPAVETAIAWTAQTSDDPLATVDDEPTGRRHGLSDTLGNASAMDQQTVDELLLTLRAVRDGQAHLAGVVKASEARVASVEEKLESLEKQTAFLPPKLRGLGKKVGELNSSLSDQRTRDLMKDVLDLGDLVEAALRSLPGEIDAASPLADAQRFFMALKTRFDQVLEAHHVVEIETACDFDPEVHQAVESQAVHTASENGSVTEVFRRGFRTEHLVLRYAEVAVGKLVDRRREDGEDTREDTSLVAPTLTPKPRDRRTQGETNELQSDPEPGPKPDAEKSDG